jgi:hypothetical protein
VHTKLSDRQMNGWLYEWTHGQIGQKQNVSPRSIDFNLYNFWWWFKLKIAKIVYTIQMEMTKLYILSLHLKVTVCIIKL